MEIVVGIGEYKVARGNVVLKTIGLGSCVGLALYEPSKSLGALAHIMLPKSPNGSEKNPKYADHAVELMINSLELKGADRRKMVAKITGGAQIFKHITIDSFKIGERNVETVRSILKDYGIKIVSEDTGGNAGRTVFFYVGNGKMAIKYSTGDVKWI